MSYKVFIDGASGTTGLKIHEYMKNRDDLEVIQIDYEKRHDIPERVKLIEEADITFLCLPDDAAREIAKAAPEDARIIDTSTAHRTDESWVYGMPEMSKTRRERIKNANRVANPGCHATGVIMLIKPLIDNALISRDYPFAVTSITGYSGGGKNMIVQYESEERTNSLESPRQYGITQEHKHIPEIMKYTGLTSQPAFMPIVADYYSGMEVIVPIKGSHIAETIFEKTEDEKDREFIVANGVKRFVENTFKKFYERQPLVKLVENSDEGGFIAANRLSDTNELEISIEGTDENILLIATFDNLGKGASGAAIQNMNIMLGLDETTGLI